MISLGYFYGIWEITIGTKSLSETISYGQMQTALISAILAFGGISTAIQVQSQIKDTDLTLHRYLPYKRECKSIFRFSTRNVFTHQETGGQRFRTNSYSNTA